MRTTQLELCKASRDRGGGRLRLWRADLDDLDEDLIEFMKGFNPLDGVEPGGEDKLELLLRQLAWSSTESRASPGARIRLSPCPGKHLSPGRIGPAP